MQNLALAATKPAQFPAFMEENMNTQGHKTDISVCGKNSVVKRETLIQSLARTRAYLYQAENHCHNDDEIDDLTERQNEMERQIALASPTCLEDAIIQLETVNECYSAHMGFSLGEPLELQGDCHATDLQLIRTALAYLKSLTLHHEAELDC